MSHGPSCIGVSAEKEADFPYAVFLPSNINWDDDRRQRHLASREFILITAAVFFIWSSPHLPLPCLTQLSSVFIRLIREIRGQLLLSSLSCGWKRRDASRKSRIGESHLPNEG